MKIVIIEDEIRIREGISRLLLRLDENYQIVGEAENGKNGYELIRNEQPDIVITDIKMPEMDGLEMLSLLYQENRMPKVIVLSAYSEFEYARSAMRLGIREYILKPIMVGDILGALKRLEEEIRQEHIEKESVFTGVEQLFSGILWGGLEISEKLKRHLREHYQVAETMTFDLICLYLGRDYEEKKEAGKKELRFLLSSQNEWKYIMLEAEKEQAILLLVYGGSNVSVLERWIQYQLLKNSEHISGSAVGFIAKVSLEELRQSMEILLDHMEWNISLGKEVVISWPKVTKLQTIPCIYPLEQENQMKLAVCTGDSKKIKASVDKFCEYFRKGLLYQPGEIKECFVRFLWALMNTGKEVGILEYEGLEQQRILEQIMGAKSFEELYFPVNVLLGKMRKEEEEILHLTVKRAQSLIHEFYQNGITLEEIAMKLNLTPEYLGAKFHKEMGVTFSNYIKQYRLTKAKELLIGTNLKLYEIAQKTGYSDPKYFSKVFKEATGQLPADYRKTH